jgi:hypothetical protein
MNDLRWHERRSLTGLPCLTTGTVASIDDGRLTTGRLPMGG